MYPWFYHICHQTQLQLPHQLMANESRVDPNEDFSKTVSWLLPAAFQRHESQWESPLTHRPAAFEKNQGPGQEIPSALLIVWISITSCIREQRSEVRGVCRQCWYGRCELGTADVQFHTIWGTYHVLGRCRFIWMMIMGSCCCCWVFLSSYVAGASAQVCWSLWILGTSILRRQQWYPTNFRLWWSRSLISELEFHFDDVNVGILSVWIGPLSWEKMKDRFVAWLPSDETLLLGVLWM